MIARFSTSYGAEQCITTMHGTIGLDVSKPMKVYYWDGDENFEARRDFDEEERRVDEFGDWLNEANPEDHLTELDKVNGGGGKQRGGCGESVAFNFWCKIEVI